MIRRMFLFCFHSSDFFLFKVIGRHQRYSKDFTNISKDTTMILRTHSQDEPKIFRRFLKINQKVSDFKVIDRQQRYSEDLPNIPEGTPKIIKDYPKKP